MEHSVINLKPVLPSRECSSLKERHLNLIVTPNVFFNNNKWIFLTHLSPAYDNIINKITDIPYFNSQGIFSIDHTIASGINQKNGLHRQLHAIDFSLHLFPGNFNKLLLLLNRAAQLFSL